MSLYEYEFVWPYPAYSVLLKGSFDNWSSSIRMKKSGSTFTAKVLVPYDTVISYKYIVDGEWSVDSAKPTEFEGYNQNNVLKTSPAPPPPAPKPAPVEVPAPATVPVPAPAPVPVEKPVVAAPTPAPAPVPVKEDPPKPVEKEEKVFKIQPVTEPEAIPIAAYVPESSASVTPTPETPKKSGDVTPKRPLVTGVPVGGAEVVGAVVNIAEDVKPVSTPPAPAKVEPAPAPEPAKIDLTPTPPPVVSTVFPPPAPLAKPPTTTPAPAPTTPTKSKSSPVVPTASSVPSTPDAKGTVSSAFSTTSDATTSTTPTSANTGSKKKSVLGGLGIPPSSSSAVAAGDEASLSSTSPVKSLKDGSLKKKRNSIFGKIKRVFSDHGHNHSKEKA